MKSVFLIAAASVVVAGCGTIEAVYLVNPETGDEVQCGPYSPFNVATAKIRLDQQLACVADFREQGYDRVGIAK